MGLSLNVPITKPWTLLHVISQFYMIASFLATVSITESSSLDKIHTSSEINISHNSLWYSGQIIEVNPRALVLHKIAKDEGSRLRFRRESGDANSGDSDVTSSAYYSQSTDVETSSVYILPENANLSAEATTFRETETESTIIGKTDILSTFPTTLDTSTLNQTTISETSEATTPDYSQSTTLETSSISLTTRLTEKMSSVVAEETTTSDDVNSYTSETSNDATQTNVIETNDGKDPNLTAEMGTSTNAISPANMSYPDVSTLDPRTIPETSEITTEITSSTTEAQPKHSAMNWITIAGCNVSIFWLILSLICFYTLRRLQSIRNTIHINLAFNALNAAALTAGSVFYEQERITKNSETVFGIPCAVLAIMLHYFYLTCFTWMGVESLHIYRSLVVVLFMPKWPTLLSYVIGYVLPALGLGVCVVLNYTYYDVGIFYGSSQSCWKPESKNFVWTFLAFVLLILSTNFIFILMASKAASSAIRCKQSQCMVILAKKSRKWLCHLVILHTLLGLTWLLGFLQFDQPQTIPYMFAACISLQGFIIFLLHCIVNIRMHKHTSNNNISRTGDLSKTTEKYSIDLYGSVTTPDPPSGTFNSDTISVEQQDPLPKKRASLKGWKYSWNVGPQLSGEDDMNVSVPFVGATFNPLSTDTPL